MNGKEWRSALRAAVQKPGRQVLNTARSNISAISPGKTPLHKTYKGRLVSMGFAKRSLRMIVKLARAGTGARAIIGVRAEAFYALQFFERGTSKIPARPFLAPALEARKDTAVKEVGQGLLRRIRTIARRRAKQSPKAGA